MYYHFIRRHGCGARICRRSAADQFIQGYDCDRNWRNHCRYRRLACLHHAAGSDQQKPFHWQSLERFAARPYLRDFRLQLVSREAIRSKGTTILNSFVEGAYNGLAVGRIIFPYILRMLVAISLFRNSGLFEMFAAALARTFRAVHVSDQIVNALPIAILRPFNSAGSRGFLLDAMYTYGADPSPAASVASFNAQRRRRSTSSPFTSGV